MSITNKDTQQTIKINEYIAPTVLVLVIFDDVYEIYRALNIIAKKEGVFPKELVVINIGTKTIEEIVGYFTCSKKILPKDENLKNYFTRVEINKSMDEDERKYDIRYIAKDDFKKEMEKDFFNGSDYKFPLFTKEHIKVISPELFAKNQTVISEKIQEIFNVVRKREIKFSNISFKLPSKSYGMNNKVNDVEVECAKLSQYLKFSVEQEKTIIDATMMTSYKVDMACDENTIHLCVSKLDDRLDDKLLLRIAFLMGRISRKHDLTSIIDSKYYRDKRFGALDKGQDTLPFDEHIELLPRYVKEYNTQLNFLPIERVSDKIQEKCEISQDVNATTLNTSELQLKKASTRPEIKFYTQKDKDFGTPNRPMYKVIFNNTNIYLSLKYATYLYSWLSINNGGFLKENKELGLEKARCYCKLLGADEDDVENAITMIKYIGESAPSQMPLIIGKAWLNISIALKAKLLQSGKVISKKEKELKYPKISNISNDELRGVLDQEQIGGYCGGETESIDKSKFMKSVASQLLQSALGSTDGLEWLIPKSIDKILTSENEFEMLKTTPKTDDKNDLVKFLHKNNESWKTYQKIIKKYESPEYLPKVKSTNPKLAKKFVSALIDYDIYVDDEW